MHEHDYCTYIMASRSRTLYVGVTGDLQKHVFQHKWREHEGFTARYNCDRLVWFERHQYVQNAIALRYAKLPVIQSARGPKRLSVWGW